MVALPDQEPEPAVVTIKGGRTLRGRVRVRGYKHGMVLGFAAAVALGADLTLSNAPRLSERDALAAALAALGGCVTDRGDLRVHGAVTSNVLPAAATRSIHGSVYLIPAVLAQRGGVTFSGAGGDGLGRFEWGLPRPLRHMLEVMAAFGATWYWRDETLHVQAPRLRPTTVDIRRWSTESTRPAGPYVSGATKTALLMAAATDGTSAIENPHDKETQHELIGMLRRLGVAVEQRDGCWLVHGGNPRSSGRYELMTDPAELITWQAFATMTGSTLTMDCGDTARVAIALRRELRFLAALGMEPTIGTATITVGPASRPYDGTDLVAESTGISTDNVPLLATLLLKARTPSTVEDRVWSDRFGYAAQLRAMGARMEVADRLLKIKPSTLHAADTPLRPADTRSAAVCLAAALAAPGTTTVAGLAHLARGYEDLLSKLAAVGADVATEPAALPCSA